MHRFFVADKVDLGVIADSVAYLCLSPRSDLATPSMPPALHGAVVDAVYVDLHA